MRRLTLATVATVLLLAGCTSGEGSDDTAAAPAPDTSGSPTTATSTPKDEPAPECDEVWKAGNKLPADYTTCLEDGQTAASDVVPCVDGSSLVVHLDTFYGITGHKISEPDVAPLQDTDEFGEAYATCTGE